ncbi:NAD-dependent epimerase/dehydratase family protein [Algoriphagus persicinus]|uniref:NAD-dependent epimerase/dehydratase family protein n=1 Tax=Algoriphagus persicinus TaxID=3108754 RepID=UPI002B38B1C2|nr:NAD(P)-dependent oxidoreductase [Algoriphagus sp. E1-3-M2]MEB2785125.1 NAD(P)-dependent oxidoreductase [Algoriphagus sp. E1-3-M2]
MSASKKYFTKESKILLLGGNGYLGSHFSAVLEKVGFSNILIGSRKGEGARHLTLDICSPDSVQLIREEKFDFIFNFTGQISRPIQACLLQNTLGIQHLIQACAEHTKLIQLSSVGVYGSGDFVDESHTCQPETPYSTLKLAAEELILAGLKPENRLILRLSNIYGSTQPKGVFAYLLRAGLSDQVLDFNNDGSLFRFFLHVEDLSQAILMVMESMDWGKTPILNMVGRDHFNVHQLIDLFEKNLGLHYQRNFEPIRPYDNMMKISDKVFRDLTEFEERFTLEAYIKELV